MSNTDFNTDFISQFLEILLENVVPGTVAATSITLYQDRSGIGVEFLSVGVPPMTKAITSKLAGIVAGAKLDVADIETAVVETMWNDNTFSQTGEIVVVGAYLFEGI
jgi:hypothetical protein